MAPNKKKWDDKMERDFLLAIRIAESNYTSITRETWNRATELMKMMGYPDSTWTGISQRWSKNIQKDFQAQYPQALEIAAGTAATTTTTTTQDPATTSAASGSGSGSGPVRKGRASRPPKRELEEEEEDHEDEEEKASAKKAPVAKKQKKN